MKTAAPRIATPWRLRILSTALLPLWLLQSVIRSLRDGGWIYFRQRLGFYGPAVANDHGLVADSVEPQHSSVETIHIWIHCASVGEVKTALPLIKHLSDSIVNARFTVTTLTPTGKQLLQKLHSQLAKTTVRHSYLPIDHGLSVKRFLQQFRPHCVLIVETEIWPSLYHGCYQRKIPLVIVNGRLSQKTERVKNGLAGKFIAPLLADALATANLVLARSSEDAGRFENLLKFSGHHRDNPAENGDKTDSAVFTDLPAIHVCGNLKDLASDDAVLSTPPLSGPYCLLASTHDDEELRLTKAWQAEKRSELLVVVPRHPERGAGIQKQLQSYSFHVMRRSQPYPVSTDKTANADHAADREVIEANRGQISGKDSVYIADTLGELERFYQHASAVFVGGSLVNVGGHNVYEAARASCAIVVGPHMHNFESEMSALLQADAIIQTDSAEAAIRQLCFFLDNPPLAEASGAAAAQVVSKRAEQSDVMDSYMKYLLKIIKQQSTKTRNPIPMQ